MNILKNLCYLAIFLLLSSQILFADDIHRAAARGDLELVISSLEKNHELLDAKDNEGNTLLHVACLNGKQNVAEFLISQKADVNLIDNGKDTPLHGAAWHGKKSTVELLLASGAQISPENAKGRTPFDNATKQGHDEVVWLLETKGAEKGPHVNEETGKSGEIDRIKEGWNKPVTFTILYDNYLHKEGTKTDWGFSCLIEGTEKTILFDTGTQPEILLHNVKALNVDLKKVEQIVITHDHGDHTGGLSEVLNINPNVSVYLPVSFPYEFVRKVEMSKARVESVDEPVEICDNVFLTGEMVGHAKEQSLIINTQKGLVIVTGCSHQGIVKVLKRAKDILDKPIYLVFGGFHLGGTSDRTVQKIIQSFEELDVEKCGATHCTGDRAIDMFKKAFGENYMSMGTGKVFKVHVQSE